MAVVFLLRTTKSQQRYSILLHCLRFDNVNNRAEPQATHKLTALRRIFDYLFDNCKTHYPLTGYLTIIMKLEPFRRVASYLLVIPHNVVRSF